MNKYTTFDFQAEFPDDAACLDFLKNLRWPDGIFCDTCQRVTLHHRVIKRMSYSCDRCGHHVFPQAGTIYERSRTPLRLWFYATFLMASTRCGVSAKQIQRETGVTYKTAWRMFRQIRKLLAERVDPFTGHVEMDETYVGGRQRGIGPGRPKPGGKKVPVFGIVQRGGKVVAVKAKNVQAATVMPLVHSHVLPRTNVYTDEFPIYKSLTADGYIHRRIHHASKVYVAGTVHTNTIEGFWSLMKRGINGVYHAVSEKYLQSYLNEYTFRYNHRQDETPMFRTMLCRVPACGPDETPA